MKPFLGKHHTKETKNKISLAMLGNKSWTGKKHSEETKQKMRISQREKEKHINIKGKSYEERFGIEKAIEIKNKQKIARKNRDKQPNWKGGINPINRQIRNSQEIKEWRKAVFERDDYTCQKCGIRGVVLHAHHDLSFALYPDLRFEVLNGETLCKKCHYNYHSKLMTLTSH